MKTPKSLTVTSYGEKENESYRITLNHCNVEGVEAQEALVQRQGMNLYRTIVTFVGGGSGELYVTREGLELIETVIGFYDYED